MDPAEQERFRKIEEIFYAAIERAPGAERDALVGELCDADQNLHTEVALLLADHERILAAAPAPARQATAAPPDLAQRFGPYQTERLLGRGGMGAVYLARRVDGAFEQTIALKVIAAHLAAPEFVRDFCNERQLLAALAHPHITRLLDGGVSECGDPYLAMEYVDGRPLDQYCDAEKLSIEARIRLFLQVCDAVEFAHRNLVVHGDLKPANVLVTADGTAKLLDFGTAKLLQSPGGKVTQFNLLTPRYASPEQVRGERVSTATDVFSLGVTLYEMLTGAWPFGDPHSVADGLERVLHGRPATTPAKALSEGKAAERSTSLDRLRRQLAGDLSTILLKMLEGDPAKRYGSVREVKEDLERVRQSRPIHARPRSAVYAARKFAARHWLAVPATAVAVAVVASLVGVSVYQSARARAQAERAQRVSVFLRDTFLSASPYLGSPLRGRRDAIQFRDILDGAAERADKELGNDPEAEAGLRATLGATYSMLGEPEKGERQLRLGLQLLPRTPGGAPEAAGRLYHGLCDALNFRGLYADALSACRQAVAVCRVSDHARLGAVLHGAAFMAANAGEPLADAEAMYREALRVREGDQPVFVAVTNSRIGMLRLRQGDIEGGERILLDAERVLHGQGEPLVEVVPVLYARAFAADLRGHYPEAVRLMAEALDLVTRRRAWFLDPDERALQLAAYEALAGDPGALARLRDVELRLSYAVPAPVDRIRHHFFAGIVEAHCGSPAAAEQHLRAAIATQQQEMSRQPDLSVEPCLRLMELLIATGRTKEAEMAARQGLDAAARAYGSYFAGHPFALTMRKRFP